MFPSVTDAGCFVVDLVHVKYSLIGKKTHFLHTLAQNSAEVQQITIRLLKQSQLGLLWVSVFHLFHYPLPYALQSTKAKKKIGKNRRKGEVKGSVRLKSIVRNRCDKN